MLQDLAALTPPLLVCAAFLIGLGMFLRRQLGPGGQRADSGEEAEIPDDRPNASAEEATGSRSPEHGNG